MDNNINDGSNFGAGLNGRTPFLAKNFCAWEKWKKADFVELDFDGYVSWTQMQLSLRQSMIDLACHYWRPQSRFALGLEFQERMERLGVFPFLQRIDHVTGLIVDPQNGTIELRMVPRSGDALMEIVAHMKCAACSAERASLPITDSIHLVAFASGIDSPCGCQQQIDRKASFGATDAETTAAGKTVIF